VRFGSTIYGAREKRWFEIEDKSGDGLDSGSIPDKIKFELELQSLSLVGYFQFFLFELFCGEWAGIILSVGQLPRVSFGQFVRF